MNSDERVQIWDESLEICQVSVEIAQSAVILSKGDVRNAAVALLNAGVRLACMCGEHGGRTPEDMKAVIKSLVDTLVGICMGGES